MQGKAFFFLRLHSKNGCEGRPIGLAREAQLIRRHGSRCRLILMEGADE